MSSISTYFSTDSSRCEKLVAELRRIQFMQALVVKALMEDSITGYLRLTILPAS